MQNQLQYYVHVHTSCQYLSFRCLYMCWGGGYCSIRRLGFTILRPDLVKYVPLPLPLWFAWESWAWSCIGSCGGGVPWSSSECICRGGLLRLLRSLRLRRLMPPFGVWRRYDLGSWHFSTTVAGLHTPVSCSLASTFSPALSGGSSLTPLLSKFSFCLFCLAISFS